MYTIFTVIISPECILDRIKLKTPPHNHELTLVVLGLASSKIFGEVPKKKRKKKRVEEGFKGRRYLNWRASVSLNIFL